jgi:YVTN family beta-propeller protein
MNLFCAAANNRSNTVSVVETATNTVIPIVPVGISPFRVAATPDRTKVYVANDDPHDIVSVIDTGDERVTRQYDAGASAAAAQSSLVPNGGNRHFWSTTTLAAPGPISCPILRSAVSI